MTSTEPRIVQLDVRGMTCASCAARVEKALNALDGVDASVNLALEVATVEAGAGIPDDALVGAVERLGYGASLHHQLDTGAGASSGASVDGTTGAAHDHDHGGASGGLDRLVFVALLAVPVVAVSMVPRWQFDGWQWFAAALALPVVTWGAWPFHRAALAGLRHRAASMDTLVSLGVVAATAVSAWALTGPSGELGYRHEFTLLPRTGGHHGMVDLYLEVAVGVTAFLLLGRWLEGRAKRRAGAALRALLDLGAKDVAVLDDDGNEQRIPVDRLVVGQRFRVRPGEALATDGEVLEGTSAVDESVLTGESVPVEVGPGSAVTGATTNAGGVLVVRATRVGADTRLARIGRLVAEAQSGKAEIQRLADRVSAVFVPAVVVLAVATVVAWLLTGASVERALVAAVSVLVVACPCALGLATPTALLVGTGRGAQLGILIRGPEVLESTRRVDTVVLDKTGTLTAGSMVARVVVGDADAVALAAAVEAGSEHPIGRAVAGLDSTPGSARRRVEGFRATAGFGVEGTVDGAAVRVGRPAPGLPEPLAAAVDAAEASGNTAVVVAVDGTPRAVLAVADAVRPTSREAVAALRGLGLRPVLLTGDNPRTAAAVAAEVGIEPGDVVAGVDPEGKVAAVQALQREGHVVAMVGDGVNDAAALAVADLGVAMGTGTDAAIESGDITLVAGDVRVAADAVRLSRRTLRVIQGNLFWAFAYNVAALPVAAFGLLNPMLAGAAMAFSSVFVVTNSLRLRRFR